MPTTTTLAQLRFATTAHRDGDSEAAKYHLMLALIDTIDDLGNMLAKVNINIVRLDVRLEQIRLSIPRPTSDQHEDCEQDSIPIGVERT